MSVEGGLGADRLVLDDSLPSSAQTYTLTAGSIARGTVGFAFNTAVEDVSWSAAGRAIRSMIKACRPRPRPYAGRRRRHGGLAGLQRVDGHRRGGPRPGQLGDAVAGRHGGERAVTCG